MSLIITWQTAEYDPAAESAWMPDGWVLEVMPNTNPRGWGWLVMTPAGECQNGGDADDLECAKILAADCYRDAIR